MKKLPPFFCLGRRPSRDVLCDIARTRSGPSRLDSGLLQVTGHTGEYADSGAFSFLPVQVPHGRNYVASCPLAGVRPSSIRSCAPPFDDHRLSGFSWLGQLSSLGSFRFEDGTGFDGGCLIERGLREAAYLRRCLVHPAGDFLAHCPRGAGGRTLVVAVVAAVSRGRHLRGRRVRAASRPSVLAGSLIRL